MHADRVRRLGRLAWLLDSAVAVPGLKFRIGLDALIGLVPGFGDAAGVLLSSYIVHEAWRLGAPKSVLIRMWLNVVVEGIVGAVPLLGDLFDAVWKANLRNVALLEAHVRNPRRTVVASRALLAGLAITIVLVVGCALAVGWLAARWLMQLAGV
ncbi:MAG TPA: DUF4112 domain-containing protein [Burkholderiales bacterium]